MPANPLVMKHWNMNQIRKILLEHETCTIPELSKLSGLSSVTLHSLISQMEEHDEVNATSRRPSSGGRPAVAYQYNASYRYSLCITMVTLHGEDTLVIEVNDLYKKSICKDTVLVRECTLDTLRIKLQSYIDKYKNIGVLAVAIPGVPYSGKIRKIDYPLFQNGDFFQELGECLGISILLENDINAAVLGYVSKHHLEATSVAGLYLPRKYPPGSALLLDGKLHTGAHGMAGELKFLAYDYDWSKLPFSIEEHNRIAQKLILSITCMYDPDVLLVYTTDLTRDLQEIRTSLQAQQDTLLYPDMILCDQLIEDIGWGMKELAHRELMKQIMD